MRKLFYWRRDQYDECDFFATTLPTWGGLTLETIQIVMKLFIFSTQRNAHSGEETLGIYTIRMSQSFKQEVLYTLASKVMRHSKTDHFPPSIFVLSCHHFHFNTFNRQWWSQHISSSNAHTYTQKKNTTNQPALSPSSSLPRVFLSFLLTRAALSLH